MTGQKTRVTAGFLPLLDAAILIAARDGGFAEDADLELFLLRETSWANVRDRMAIGHFDAAHMLAPMPIAVNLGLTPFSTPLIAPMALGLGGNAVTISSALATDSVARPDPTNARAAGLWLKSLIGERSEQRMPPLKFGVVHPHSAHNLELRYWLAGCSIDPDRDIEIVILPPPFMPDALENGTIDGFCVGEPWNTRAVLSGTGTILTTKEAIWSSSPEKVLALNAGWADENPDTLSRLIQALYQAARWCGDPANHGALADMLSRPSCLDQDARTIRKALCGPAGFEPYARAATYPWKSHALWFYSQFVRWGFAANTAEAAGSARNTYRPDLYRKALSGSGAIVPTANAKVEGALSAPTGAGATGGTLILGPDGFFDQQIFDPDDLDSYIISQMQKY